MALTSFQRAVCKLLAQDRIASGESYVAGAAALNELLNAPRVSRDVDVFHDTERAVDASWSADRKLLEGSGFVVHLVRERSSFVEAEVRRGADSVLLQWVRDSAYRFFPLLEHAELGLVLHPFDLATNKVLALVGRLEVRDWVDVVECSERLQPLGYLAWAASGKDPGFSPLAILEQAGRSSHYSADEVASLAFEGPAPDAADLGRRFHAALADAKTTVGQLPTEQLGKCVLDEHGQLFRAEPSRVRGAVASGTLAFHAGSIRGAWPELVR
jgi:hypothetical protein